MDAIRMDRQIIDYKKVTYIQHSRVSSSSSSSEINCFLLLYAYDYGKCFTYFTKSSENPVWNI